MVAAADHPDARTPEQYPYGFEAYICWEVADFLGAKAAAGRRFSGFDTDRLTMWDFAKHDRLNMKHFGNKAQLHWGSRSPKLIEAFVRDWCEDPGLRLVQIIAQVNVGNGFPLWSLVFIHSEEYASRERIGG